MAQDIERLIITLEARTKEYERALLKAQGTTLSALKKIERDTAASATRQQATFAGMGAGIKRTIQTSILAPLGALAGVAGARALVGFADAFTGMENSLKVAGVQGEALGATMERLFEIANKHSAPVDALTVLYGRLALSQKELNISSEEMIQFTDNVGAALRVSGRSAAQSSGALLQLSQALGSGTVRAEELNSILEGAQPILQAVANGLDEAGGSIAKLRQLVIDGKVSSEVFFRAFMAGGSGLQQQASQAEKTVGQAMTNIRNAFIEAVGSVDNMTEASKLLGAGLGELANQIRLAVHDLNEIKDAGVGLIGFFQTVDDTIRKFGRDIGIASAIGEDLEKAKTLLTQYRQALTEAIEEENAVAVIGNQNMIVAMIEEINRLDPGPVFERLGREGGAAFNQGLKETVSLDDVAGGDSKALEKQREAVEKLIASLKAEVDVLRALDPVTARMIQLRETLAGATEEEAAQVRQLIADTERESAAKQGRESVDALIASMQQENDVLRATDPVMKRMIGLREDLANATEEQREQIRRLIIEQERLNRVSLQQGPLDFRSSVTGTFVDQRARVGGGGSGIGGGVSALSRDDIATAVGVGVRDMHTGVVRAFEVGFSALGRHGDRITDTTGRAADTLRSVDTSVIGSGDRITGAIGQQTATLMSGLDRMAAAAAAANAANTSGAFGGSIGGSESIRFNVNQEAQRRADALARERDVLQAGLQFRQLTPEEERAAQLRIAEIDLQTAQLNQSMAETEAAFNSLAPELNRMLGSAMSLSTIMQLMRIRMADILGGSAFSGGNIFGGLSGFAGGGVVPGAPSKTDSVPVMLAPGERVFDAFTSRKFRPLFDAIASGRVQHLSDGGIVSRLNGAVQRLANGGMVQAAPAGAGRGNININLGGVNVMAQESGRVSETSAREAGRQIAREVAYHMREMRIS